MVKKGLNKPKKWDPSLIGTTDHFVPSGEPIPKSLIAKLFGVSEKADEQSEERASKKNPADA